MMTVDKFLPLYNVCAFLILFVGTNQLLIGLSLVQIDFSKQATIKNKRNLSKSCPLQNDSSQEWGSAGFMGPSWHYVNFVEANYKTGWVGRSGRRICWSHHFVDRT